MDYISAFNTIREDSGVPLKACSLAMAGRRSPGLIDRCACVAAAIRTNFLHGAGWRFRVHDASLTFFHEEMRHRAVKILVDAEGVLARKAGVSMPPNPVVVGIELTNVNPFTRWLIREYLSRQFGEYYLDPTKPRGDSLQIVSNEKYWIAPHSDHFYDIIFLPPGQLPVRAEAAIVDEFRRRIVCGLRVNY
jgi:hypothetical protein